MKLRILFGILLAFLISTGIAHAHGDPELLVSPERVEAGASVHVKGMMVTENGTIVVTLEGDQFRAALGVAQGDAEGSFEADFPVPEKIPPGDYQVRALGSDGREASAKITVAEAGASTANGVALPTSISVAQRDGMLTAILTDAEGKPLADQTVAFTQRTIFGTLMLGVAQTDAMGTARLPLERAPQRETELAAEFNGNQRWAQSRTTLVLNPGVRGEYTQAAPSLTTPMPPPLLGGIIFGLASIAWICYAVVVYQLFRIVKPKPIQVGGRA